MPNISAHKCLACGASLNAPVQGGKIKCIFCGTITILDPHEKKKGDEIICPECGAVNPKDAQHCGRCGIKLEFNCPKCGALNSYGTVYCVQCGVDIQLEIKRQQQETLRQQEEEVRRQEEIRQRNEKERRRSRISFLVVTGIVIVVVLCIASVAGIGIYKTSLSPEARSTKTAMAIEQTATAKYNTLFQDDFSDTNSGWGYYTNENGSADYESGGFRINVITPNWLIWDTLPDVFQNDVRIEVNATRNGGPDNNILGIICRYQEDNSFYFLAMSSDGYAAIVKTIQGEFNIISSDAGQMVKVAAINQGYASNHIRADCVGSTLTLYINGIQAVTVTDNDFPEGLVGLEVGTGSTGGADVLFKNFFVYRP